MGRLPKTATQLRLEGKSHKTKAELAQREQAEQAWRTGWPIECTDEIKADPVAMAEFERVTAILTVYGTNDELFGNRVRRYCTTTSELYSIWDEIKKLQRLAIEHANDKQGPVYDKLADKFERHGLRLCAELREFEHEYGMTVVSSMQMGKAKKEPSAADPLLDILGM